MVAPIYHGGFIIGVLGMDILYEDLLEQINSIEIYETGFAFLMDRDGKVVYHPEMDVALANMELTDSLERDLLRRRGTCDMLVRYTHKGQPWQLAFSILTDDHKVAITAPVSEITASQRRITLLLLLVAVVILAIFTIVTMVLMGTLTRPLIRLTAASKRLIAGDYEVELDYDGQDEVGILTQAFRQMRDHLKLYITNLNKQAHTDAMTGVKNKGMFNESMQALNEEILSKNGDVEFAIVIFDLNNLKGINDAYGHARGDIYLQTACRMICKVFTHSPVFRMGGDEFSVILQRGDYLNREVLWEEFDQRVIDHNQSAKNPWDEINVSKGMAVYNSAIDKIVEQVLTRADDRMYEAKRASKVKRG